MTDGRGVSTALRRLVSGRFGLSLRLLPQSNRGVAAVEFALVAIPFLLLLMGPIEVGIFLIVNRNLSNAVATTARQVRVGSVIATGTGTTQSSGTSLNPSDFKAAICANIGIIARATCTANLQVDMRILTSFTNGTVPNPVTAKSFSNNGFCFYSGVPGQIVEMRSYYLWPLATPLLWPTLANITSSTINGATKAGHWALASVTNVFVNEPNGATANNGSGC